MKICAIGGEPGSGKSTLVKQIISQLPDLKPFKYLKLRGLYSGPKNLFILGVYEEGEVFSGTDRLSMAVQPDADKFLTHVLQNLPTHNILFEGDRLFNGKFLTACEATAPTRAYVLTVSDEEKKRRYAERGTNQNEQFLRSRATKYRNILGAFQLVKTHENQTPAQKDALVAEIAEFFSL